mmetsp:Transcript_34277/g.57565  ORF Transcript_34277/g.57565 Transcript_34277/m.57565 type:complete len:279 (-) Transcript_34277:379-1215(-)
MLDRPHDGEQDGAAADDIQQVENIPPGEPTLDSRATLVKDDSGNVREHLQRDQHHDDLLFSIGEEGLEERPPGPNKDDHDKQHDAAQEREHVVCDVPPIWATSGADKMIHATLGEYSEGLGNQQARHQVVDLQRGGVLAVHGVNPHNERNEVEHEHDHEDGRKHSLPSAKEVLCAIRALIVQRHVNVERNNSLRQAVGEKQGVLPALVGRDLVHVVKGILRPLRVTVLLQLLEGKQTIDVFVVQYARTLGQIALKLRLGLGGGDEKPKLCLLVLLERG